MSEVQKFATPLGGSELSTINVDGESLFSVPDLARALGYSNTHKAMRHLPEKHVTKVPNRALGRSGGGHATPFTTEAGLYRLILRSNMPKAEEFTDWVTEELLPTVREAHEYGIDAIEELKERIFDLELENGLYKLSDKGASAREEKAYNRGVMWGQDNPDLRLSSVYGFDEWAQDFS